MKTIISIFSEVFNIEEKENILIIDKAIEFKGEEFYLLKIITTRSGERILKVLYKGDVYEILLTELDLPDILCNYGNYIQLIEVIKDLYNKNLDK